jgi:hypothetical protein
MGMGVGVMLILFRSSLQDSWCNERDSDKLLV